MSITHLGRWLDEPCRTCNSNLTSLEHPAHMELLRTIPIWDRASCVLGHCSRHHNILPDVLEKIYRADLDGRLEALTRIVDTGLSPLPISDGRYPRQDLALIWVDKIDLGLKKWAEAWSDSNQKNQISSIASINRRLDLLSPSRRNLDDAPGDSGIFSELGRSYHTLGHLIRIIYRLQDVAADYDRKHPHWRFSPTKDVRCLVTKTMFIIRDVLWKEGHITVEGSITPPAPDHPDQDNNTQTESSPNHNSDTTSPGHNTEAGPSSENDNDAQSSSRSSNPPAEENLGTRFNPINRPRRPEERHSDTVLEGSHSPASAVARPENIHGAGSSNSAAPSEAPNENEAQPSPPGPTSSPSTKRKRERERAKGVGIINGGREASKPCERCAKSHKTCMVPTDPKASGTFKCGDCIKGQLGCSLSALNPGREDYDEEHRRLCIAKEDTRRTARAKAQDAKDTTTPGGPVKGAGAKRKLRDEEQELPRESIAGPQDRAEQAEEGSPDVSQSAPPAKRRTPLPTSRRRAAASSSRTSSG